MKKTFLILSLAVLCITGGVMQSFAEDISVKEQEKSSTSSFIDEKQQIKNDFLIKNVNREDLKNVDFALKTGSDINYKDSQGWFPLMTAVIRNNYEITKFLIDKGADLNQKSGKHYGKSGVYDYGTPLMYSAKNGTYNISEQLVKSGADVNLQNEDGFTALMYSAMNGDKKTTKLLLDNKADINIQNLDKMTALTFASRYGQTKTAKMLIDKGTDVNHIHYYRKTALMEACDNGHFETVKLLVNNGADVNLKNNGGKTALDIAKESRESAVKKGNPTEDFDKIIKFLHTKQ